VGSADFVTDSTESLLHFARLAPFRYSAQLEMPSTHPAWVPKVQPFHFASLWRARLAVLLWPKWLCPVSEFAIVTMARMWSFPRVLKVLSSVTLAKSPELVLGWKSSPVMSLK
jgi:hypothetical protein